MSTIMSRVLSIPHILDGIVSQICNCSDKDKETCYDGGYRHCRALYKFLLVSKGWTEVVVPRLWSNHGKLSDLFALIFEKTSEDGVCS